jgi:hypothetical protein
MRGELPGWIYGHRAARLGPNEIRVSGGTVVTTDGAGEVHAENSRTFVLDLGRLLWRREE